MGDGVSAVLGICLMTAGVGSELPVSWDSQAQAVMFGVPVNAATSEWIEVQITDPNGKIRVDTRRRGLPILALAHDPLGRLVLGLSPSQPRVIVFGAVAVGQMGPGIARVDPAGMVQSAHRYTFANAGRATGAVEVPRVASHHGSARTEGSL